MGAEEPETFCDTDDIPGLFSCKWPTPKPVAFPLLCHVLGLVLRSEELQNR